MTTTPARTDITDEEMRAIWTRNEVYQGMWDAVNGEPTPQQVKAATDCADDVARLHYELELAQLEIAELKAKGSPGVMHEVDRAFYDLTVKERDAARGELAKTRADNERLRGRLSQVGQRLHATLQHLSAEAEDELRAAWTAEDEEAARRGFAKRMTAEMANPATTAEPAACGDSGLHPGWTCDLPAGHPERQHRQRVSGGVNTWVHQDATAEPADEQDDESLFESHRLADGTMPATIPVSDPEHDAPDGATIDGYTRQRNTWVRNAEPAAG